MWGVDGFGSKDGTISSKSSRFYVALAQCPAAGVRSIVVLKNTTTI